MKKVKLAYGKGWLETALPKHTAVIEPHRLPGLPDERRAVAAALNNPAGTKPLKDMVSPSDSVAIVISDLTRPTPNHKLVPWLLEELSFIPRENFTIINGLGSHRANTREELIQMLGREIAGTVKIENHDAFDDSKLVYVGQNTYGSKVYLNKTYVNSAFKIATGFIEPHFFAGFSGGPKAICPGVASISTILDFHNATMIGHPNTTWGKMEDNILQDAAVQNCLMAKPDFILNVTLNDAKEITGVFAGDVIAAHRAGCGFVKEHAMYGVEHLYDIVITTNSGYPLDQNLYQTVKGMSAAAQIVRRGGVIIAVSECSDGLPGHGNYGKLLQMRETPAELLSMITEPSFSVFDQWQVQTQAIIQMKADCYLYSALDSETVRKAKLLPISSIEQTLEKLLQKNPAAKVAVMPQGPMTIPYLKQEAEV